MESVTASWAAKAYYVFMSRREEEEWNQFNKLMCLASPSWAELDPQGLLRVEALAASLAVGMIGIPDSLSGIEAQMLHSSTEAFIADQFPSDFMVKAFRGYWAAFDAVRTPGGDPVAISIHFAARAKLHAPSLDLLPLLEKIPHCFGGRFLSTSLGVWKEIFCGRTLRSG